MLRATPLERLGESFATPRGLTSEQVAARTARYGHNLILEAAPGGWLRLLTETLKDPMLWFLLGTSGVFACVGQWTEAFILLVALVPFLGMDAYLHRRTHASVEGLSTRLASRATVARDGTTTVIASTEVVPGDLVLVSAGEAFPADGLVVQGERMQVDESALTGEAFPVRKQALMAPPRRDTEIRAEGDRRRLM